MEERDAQTGDPHLSQAYREARHPEPSPAVDARILEAARQAVARPPASGHARKPARWLAWALPLSSVAVLVLGLTVLLEIRYLSPEYMQPPGATSEPGQTEITGAGPQPLPAEPTLRPWNVVPEAATPQADATESSVPEGGLAQHAPASTPTPQHLPERAAAEQWAAAPVAPEPSSFPVQPSGAPASSSPPQAAAKTEARPAPQAPFPTARDAVEAAPRLAAPPTASAAAPGRESAPAFSFSPGSGQRKAAMPTSESPEQWVETIRRLLREDRREEARQEVEKLRRAYPGFALPEDLKGL